MLTSAELFAIAPSYRTASRRLRIGWREWFTRFGVKSPYPKATLTVSDYHFAIDAALTGQDVALGWEHLVNGKVAKSEWVLIGNDRLEAGMSIYIVEPLGRASAPHLEQFQS